MKHKILISSCLLGENVKYNGGNNLISHSFLEECIKQDLLIPVCPEVIGGLPIPRIPCEIQKNKVISKENKDLTENFQNGAKKVLDICLENGVKYALLKERSPSCGIAMIYDGSFSNKTIDGMGITTELLRANGILCFSENQINDLSSIIKT